MNPANIITFVRILIVPVLAYTAVIRNSTIFLILFVIGGLTDVLDGYVARKFSLRTKIGSTLDSIADALFYPCGAFIVFFVPELSQHTVFITLLFALFIFASITTIIKRRVSAPHTLLGKISSGLLFLFVSITLAAGYWPVLFFIASSVFIASSLEKIWKCIK